MQAVALSLYHGLISNGNLTQHLTLARLMYRSLKEETGNLIKYPCLLNLQLIHLPNLQPGPRITNPI
jgi:hypothetical protein